MRCAVVGAGICGLSAARFLALRGHRVTLYEQFGLFHNRGSSHGESRIVRRAYPDAYYTALMQEAYPMWRELEQDSGEKLLHEVGLFYFGDRDSANIQSTIRGLEDLQVPFRLLSSHPSFRLHSNEVGIFTPEAGWVHAERALRALLKLASGDGLQVAQGVEASPEVLKDQYDAVIVCAGAWIRRHVNLPVKVTRMTFGYLQTKLEGPVWIEDSPSFLYGFPATSLGAKVGIHTKGTEIDPDEPSRESNSALLEEIRDFGRRRLDVDAPVLHSQGCLYTMAPNEDFILGKLAPNVFFASACSGHGFKFGPWIGRLLADFVEGKSSPAAYRRFAWTSS